MDRERGKGKERVRWIGKEGKGKRERGKGKKGKEGGEGIKDDMGKGTR